MAEATWVIRVDGTITAHIEAVVAWWCDPRRIDDLRGYWEKLGARNLVVEQYQDGGVLVRDLRWSTSGGVAAKYRAAYELGENGVTQRVADGYVVRAREISTVRLQNGREITTRCDLAREFKPDGLHSTIVSEEHRHLKVGASWWERLLPPNSERAALRKRLHDWIELCEIDVGP